MNEEWQDIPSHAGSPVTSRFTRFLNKNNNCTYFIPQETKFQAIKENTQQFDYLKNVENHKWIKSSIKCSQKWKILKIMSIYSVKHLMP